MSVIAQVKDGQLVESATTSSDKDKKVNSSLDKDAFLQLLVAQMKYQDPLEPTSNTEYISQLATFSELEEMQNLNSAMTLQRASQLVGQYVYMKVTDSSGNTTYPEGTVDYVVYENGKAYLAIEENLYSIDDLQTVADATYTIAVKAAESFVESINKLPNYKYVSRSDGEAIGDVVIAYESMTDYEKSFLSDETLELYSNYLAKYQELIVTPISTFITNVEGMDIENLTAEDMTQLESVIGTYKDFTAYQRSLIGSDTLELYDQLKAKYEELKAAEEETETGAESTEENSTEAVEETDAGTPAGEEAATE
ncbi:MAG: hypothetical protein IJP31_06860 [Lachnospiraceae bacterium]|nr:hypothetical protein [Lachnospiraceae bacterium]